MEMIMVSNDGPRITSTNFWQTAVNSKGFFYLSSNAGAYRLLVPKSREASIPDMLAGKEVIITKGHDSHFQREMVEILFDDHTATPFSLYLSVEQTDNRAADVDGFSFVGSTENRITPKPFDFLVYRLAQDGSCECVATIRGYWRRAKLPCLKPL